MAIHTIVSHHRSNPFAGNGKVFVFVRLGVEVLTILLWIASAILMLRHKKGCERRIIFDSRDSCYLGGDENKESSWSNWTDHPLITWDIAIAFSFVEMYEEPLNTFI